jgi:dipeptidyl aminopeptidase/acylaminoacyl peptidase
MPKTLPYGSWPSLVSSALLVEAVVRLGDVAVLGDEIWWVEGRPAEAGRQVLVSAAAGADPVDRIPAPFSCRTAVHEYGGNSYTLLPAPDGGVRALFANWADQALYLTGTGGPERLTPQPDVARGLRFADLAPVAGGEWVLAVRQLHAIADESAEGVDNDIVAIALPGNAHAGPGEQHVLAAGHDFFGAPRPSPDGRRVAWISWDHPSMPWDSTELWVADLGGGAGVSNARKLTGEPGESVVQPRWSPDGRLHYISDRSGWWNIYTEDGTAVAAMDAEFSTPDWILGQTSYVFLDDGRLVATWSAPGGERLGVVDPERAPQALDLAPTQFGYLRPQGNTVVAVAGSPTTDPAVVRIDVDTAGVEILKRSREQSVDPAWISVPEAIEFPTSGGRTAHALWYPPNNPDVVGPDDERPPLMVISHGGPTGGTSSVLSYGTQYWTSRGFGVVDVDYGGSSGYGREYRRQLNGTWGIVDIDDCVAAARWLADQGLVDGDRMVIRGGSAGGYTTLAALTFRDTFAAGASHFGVADLELLAKHTHKFESRYLDGLIGPYPEAIDVYRERSPIHHVEGLTKPLILFQGLEDEVVPPEQATLIAEALAARGVPVAHLTFEGEQHGFRQAATIKRVADTELAFYGRVLGFTPTDPVEPFEIVNEEAISR